MNEKAKKIFALVLLLTLAATPFIIADYAQTLVYFTVASSISFTVTLPGESAIGSSNTTPSPSTANIWFNTSSNTNGSVMPCVTGGTACQTADFVTTPIFQYDNTGTTNIDISIIFNNTLPTGIVVKMNSSTTQPTGATIHAALNDVNSTSESFVVQNLTWYGTNTSSAFMNASFANVGAGTNMRTLSHNSSAAGYAGP